jgi:glycosyltransferase involved in cell wall biosynthesis
MHEMRSARSMTSVSSDLVCFSHLRWDFVFQRPNHLMSRFARTRRVVFVEEPVFEQGRNNATVDVVSPMDGLFVLTPRLRTGLSDDVAMVVQRNALEVALAELAVEPGVLWFYNPLALPLAAGMAAEVVVYDCMDELTGFHGAPLALAERETELFSRADLVFTGGRSLWEAKRKRHPRVHAFPSSVDLEHFTRARTGLLDPKPQASLGRPRIGFFGVVDERMDLVLLETMAEQRRDWEIVVVGPVVKISEASLPRASNLHWLGQRSYDELPAYLANWDVAMLPFALNDATRFISPTKTLEYLAGGKPVVATPIADVVHPYGDLGLVRIAERGDFVAAVDAALGADLTDHVARADQLLSSTSWDVTWAAMNGLIEDVRTVPRMPSTKGDRLPCSTI